MIAKSQPAPNKTHEAARRIAQRFVWIIGEEEKRDTLREAYRIALEELEAFQAGGTPAGWREIST